MGMQVTGLNGPLLALRQQDTTVWENIQQPSISRFVQALSQDRTVTTSETLEKRQFSCLPGTIILAFPAGMRAVIQGFGSKWELLLEKRHLQLARDLPEMCVEAE